MDLTLLSDTGLPNSVILSRRWIAGDLQYEIPAPNGLHTVILYLAESCATSVNADLGGIDPNDATRILDLEVEGQRVEGYNSADAAVRPDGDGVGAALKAIQLVFRDVDVTDGILDVAVLQHDAVGGSGNASINALAVLQQPANAGAIAPHIVSIQRVQNAVQIEVAPGSNLAAHYSGLADFALEDSPNLDAWTSTGIPPVVADDKLVLENIPAGSTRFSRVAVNPASP